MRALIGVVLLAGVCLSACSSQDEELAERLASYDAFARQAYDALIRQDMNGLIDLCALPGDVDLTGKPMIHQAQIAGVGMTHREQYAFMIQRFLEDLDAAGGLSTLQLVRLGKPIGVMNAESDFVGNMFLIVNLGGEERAIEIGSSQLSQNRGRVILGGPPYQLHEMSYYNELAAIF